MRRQSRITSASCPAVLADPITLLRGAGVDMASPKPIEDATKLFDEMISEMEKILN